MQKYKLKVLYVEDQKDISIEFYKIFAKLFKTVCLAPNGKNAFKIFKENEDIDFIVTDINMPIMDGIRLIEKVREENKSIPIYVTSAFDDEFEKYKIEFNIAHYFSKPVDMVHIVNKIKEDFKLD